MTTPYAHSKSPNGDWEPLQEHLLKTARLCAAYCKEAYLHENEGYVAGLCHDLGKCGDLFQGVLHGREKRVDHESPGAYWLLRKAGFAAYDAALAIHGHHKGLVCDTENSFFDRIYIDRVAEFNGRRYSCNSKAIEEYASSIGLELREMPAIQRSENIISAMLRVRMLLSALCDADYTATDRHFSGVSDDCEYPVPTPPRFEEALEYLTAYREQLSAKSNSNKVINRLREEVYAAAKNAAALIPGEFSLTAPTGCGKTLAMLVFALSHALHHKKRRIIFVFPYLTLLEQASKEIRKALWPLSDEDGYLFEDHSLAQRSETGFLVPNWSEPIVITTTIKFFESLFSNKPADIRHLHNIADSVILFDEAQSMPFGYAEHTLEAVAELCKSYGATVLFSTATQPAFNQLNAKWAPREIVPPELKQFERARRINVRWPRLADSEWLSLEETSFEELAHELSGHKQSLTVLNTRKQAKTLTEILSALSPDMPLFHLSTNMCVAHRKETLEKVKSRLKEGLPCTLVSSQAIEAGVDISFPVVYRAYGPLDSIIQAFGRCNRNGEYDMGEARVFLPLQGDRSYPDTAYEAAANELMRIFKDGKSIDINDPQQISSAFDKLALYMKENNRDKKYKLFDEALGKRQYDNVSSNYRWIDERGINIIVPYEPMIDLYNELVEEVHRGHPKAAWLKRARQISVNIMHEKDSIIRDFLEPIYCFHNGERLETGWYYPIREDLYDDRLGIKTDFSDSIADYIS